MLRRSGLLLAVLALAGPAAPATGQETRPYAHVGAFCMGEFVQITIAGVDDGSVPDVVGFDVFRTDLGACGSTPVRVTDIPIGRLEGQFTLRYDDLQAVPDALYEYRVVGVDAERSVQTPLSQIYAGSSTNDFFYAGCGDPQLGPGILLDEGGLYRFEPCPDLCLPVLFVDPSPLPELVDFVDTGTPLRLTGRFYWGFGGPRLAPESFAVGTCGTPVTPTTWTEMKRLFR